jgi:hypothetical protein
MSLEAYFLKVVSPESDNTAFKVAPFLEKLPASLAAVALAEGTDLRPPTSDL